MISICYKKSQTDVYPRYIYSLILKILTRNGRPLRFLQNGRPLRFLQDRRDLRFPKNKSMIISMSSDQQIFNKPPSLPWRLIRTLSQCRFSSTEILIMLLCLSELDNALYLKIGADEISYRLNVSVRTVNYALTRFKSLELTKIFGRYFFGDLIKNLNLLQDEEIENGI